MKYWCPSNWYNTFDHEGLLFFVQKMQEMLFHFSADINRAPVHNTLTLAHEFLETHGEAESGKVHKSQLKTLFNELKYSFSNDSVIKSQLSSDFVDRIYLRMNSCQDNEYFTLVKYIYNIIRYDYFRWVEEYLKEHIPYGNHKQEIAAGARIWIAGVIMQGYSGEFVYNYVETIFIRKPVRSLTVLDTFFARFDFKERKHKVYFYVSDIVASYAKILDARLSLKFDDDGNFKIIKPLRRYHICYFEIDELDYYTAVAWAYKKINVFLKYYRFLSNQRIYMLYKMGYVFEVESSEMHSLPIVPNGFKTIEVRENEAIVQTLDSIITRIQTRDSTSIANLDKAIELHNSALRQQLPKDGLTNLWSILEVLCPKAETKSKLDAVLHSVLPVLQNDYFHVVFSSIYQDLKENMSKDELDTLLSHIHGDSEDFKAAAFCLLPEYEELREMQFKAWTNFPLLRDKIYKMYKVRNDKSALFALSNRYEQRVRWHLHRLYRARNAIVHEGRTNPRIQVLAEHLHSYVDNVMNEVAYKLSFNNTLSDISSIFEDTRILVDHKKNYFASSSSITSEDIEFLLSECFIKID